MFLIPDGLRWPGSVSGESALGMGYMMPGRPRWIMSTMQFAASSTSDHITQWMHIYIYKGKLPLNNSAQDLRGKRVILPRFLWSEYPVNVRRVGFLWMDGIVVVYEGALKMTRFGAPRIVYK
jgi:hypothetical protein